MKILVVDDSRTMRRMLRKVLNGMGYTEAGIIEAADGAEALEKLKQSDFQVDIVLADWNMPNMDGLSFLRRLQGDEALKRIPVVMVTGEAERDRVQEAIRAGARNYIVKPFTAETLRQKVLAIEMELLGRRKPTATAVRRIQADRNASRRKPGVPFVASLPEELAARIFECALLSEHPAGEVLIQPEEIVDSLHIVKKGEVEITGGSAGGAKKVLGRGECIGELSFLSEEAAGIRVSARTQIVLASVRKGDFEGLLAEYPHLSFYLTRLLARRGRPAGSREVDASLAGKLSMMALAELVQTLHGTKKTGVLRIRSEGDEGEIYFSEGNVREARVGEVGGEEAFYQLLTWKSGSFVFEAGRSDFEHVIFRATANLLMEGMRRQDELEKLRA